MKSFLIGLMTASAMLFSLSAAADKIIVSGQPVIVTDQNGVYTTTTTLPTGSDYYYFSMNGTNRVCYQQVNPALASATVGSYKVKFGENVVTLQCYDYSPDYFVVQ